MVYNHHTDIVPVCHRFQSRGIPVVDAVGGGGTGCLPDFLQRVNDDQLDGRVFSQHLIQLLLQSVTNQMRMGAKIQTGGSLLGQPQCADMQPPRTVLQRDVKNFVPLGLEPQKGLSTAYSQAKLQCQPAFSHFWRTTQEIQPGCQQIFHHPRDGFDRLFVEFLKRIGV